LQLLLLELLMTRVFDNSSVRLILERRIKLKRLGSAATQSSVTKAQRRLLPLMAKQ
jgi:hypothetical protein